MSLVALRRPGARGGEATASARLLTDVRARLVALAGEPSEVVALPVVGTPEAALEAALGRLVPPGGGLLILDNAGSCSGAIQTARALRTPHHVEQLGLLRAVSPDELASRIRWLGRAVTHLVFSHHDARTGLAQPLASLVQVAREHGLVTVVDASASFGSVPVRVGAEGADVVVFGSDGGLQGRAGLAWVLARPRLLVAARAYQPASAYLDLVAEAHHLERSGVTRFPLPEDQLVALDAALDALDEDGGIPARDAQRSAAVTQLRRGLIGLGLLPLIAQPAEGGLYLLLGVPPERRRLVDGLLALPMSARLGAARDERTVGSALRLAPPPDLSRGEVTSFLRSAAAGALGVSRGNESFDPGGAHGVF